MKMIMRTKIKSYGCPWREDVPQSQNSEWNLWRWGTPCMSSCFSLRHQKSDQSIVTENFFESNQDYKNYSFLKFQNRIIIN